LYGSGGSVDMIDKWFVSGVGTQRLLGAGR